MTKKGKLLILSLFMSLAGTSIFGMESKATEPSGEQTGQVSQMQDENVQRLESVTGMDESGSIFEVEETDGTFENGTRAARAVNVAQVVNFRTKGNAVTNYTEDGTGISGYTNGAYGADAAYLGTSGGKVKFMLSGVVGWVSASEVQVVSLSQVKVVSCYKASGGRLIHYIAQDMTTPGYATSLDNGAAPSYLSEGVTYYSYDGHYFYADYLTMTNDYQNNTRSHSVNSGNPYYNYFQYLPLRSRSGYSGSELTSVVNGKITSSISKLLNTGEQFVRQQDTYGVNALLMASVGANESGWGTSSISQQKNNIFGLNAVDSSPGTSASTYANVEECIRQFANGWMSRGYLYPNDWRYKGGFLGSKGSGINVSYASDPYWGEKAANIAWNLDSRGGSRDRGTYTIGIKDTIASSHNNVNVRNGDNTSTAAVYNTGTHSNYAVLMQDASPSNGFYRIQSDAVLNAQRTSVASGVGEYDFGNMYGYISADHITQVNNGNAVTPKKELQAIEITAPPAKTVYIEGEAFAPAGMKVEAVWSDGSRSDVTGQVTYTTESLTRDTQSITLQYTLDGTVKEAVQAITVKERPTVSEVAVHPSSLEMKPGESKTFAVSVTGTGKPAQTVTWSVEGAKHADTKIDTTGKLQISPEETAEILTVKAVSTVDNSKTAVASVKVIPKQTELPDHSQPDEDTPSEDPEQPETGTPPTTEVKDETSGILVSGDIAAENKLNVSVITEAGDAENYARLTEPVAGHTILGVYDIALDKALDAGKTVRLVFPVDVQYEGQMVTILHYYEVDGKLFTQTYEVAVKDGKVEITVDRFSPFVLALKDIKVEEEPKEESKEDPEQLPKGGLQEQPKVPEEEPKVPEKELQKPEMLPTPEVPKTLSGPGEGSKQPPQPVSVVNPKKAPKTGDQSPVVWIGMVMILSGAGMMFGVRRLKKRIQDEK